MTIAVRLRATVTGQRARGVREHELTLALPAGMVSVERLIEASVVAEVSAYEQRADEATLVRVLTEESLAADLERGAVRLGDLDRAATIDVGQAVETALLAWADGIFKVFVGDDEAQPGSEVRIDDGASVLFLRLVPLAGG